MIEGTIDKRKRRNETLERPQETLNTFEGTKLARRIKIRKSRCKPESNEYILTMGRKER